MLKSEIVIIRHFSRTYLAVRHVSGVTLMEKPVNFRAWSPHNDSASESGPEEADPASASTGLDAGLFQKGEIDPCVFCVFLEMDLTPTTSEPWMLGSICCVICSLFLLQDYLQFHQLGCPGLSLPVLTWELAFTTGWAKATSNGTNG